ncbi:MAG: DUF364 domain-containing protein [Firmicutes bacterium]|nr:DUF364 domain-containing protein [Bacillota bacterium]
MIMEKVLAAAKPFLEGRTVSDLVIGLSLIGCQLDNGNIGVSYVLREELPHGCSAFPFAKKVIGRPASDIAKLSISTDDCLQRSVAASVLAAAACSQQLPKDNEDKLFGIEFRSEDTVCMVGLISPLAVQISKKVRELIIFDKGMGHCKKDFMLYPMERQSELIPTCDVVIISGTTTVNGSIDGLLDMCEKAREVIMVGPSTPMFPKGWQDSNLTVLAGSCWDKESKDELFKFISLAGGIRQVKELMQKKAVAVK